MPPLGLVERRHLVRLGSRAGAAELARLVEALRLFALKSAWNLGLLGPHGVSDEEAVLDIAYDVIADVLSEEPRNRWDSAKRPLLGFLMMAVHGDLRLLRDSYGVRQRAPNEDPTGGSRLDRAADSSLSPEEWLETVEAQAAMAALIARIRTRLASADGLLGVFDMRCRGATCEEIAEALQLDVDTIYQKKNRALKRVLTKEFGVEAKIVFALADAARGEERR